MHRPKNRIKRESDFKNLYHQGKIFFNNSVKIVFLANNLRYSRFAFVVSTKIAQKATARNKTKRQMREIIRKEAKNIKKDIDCIIIAKKSLINQKFSKKQKLITDLLKRANIWEKSS